MELVGRLTANASVKQTSEGQSVVNFTVAINNGYKKNGEWVEKVVFVDCSYWQTTKIAELLMKGRQVEIFGEIGVNAYINASGAAVGKITCHVNHIKLGDKPRAKADEAKEPVAGNEPAKEDLPF